MLGWTPPAPGGAATARDFPRPISSSAWLPSTLALVAAFVLGWYGLQYVVLDGIRPSTLSSSLEEPQAPLATDTPIRLSLQGYGTQIEDLRLYRLDSSDERSASMTEEIVGLVPDGPGFWRVAGETGSSVLRPDGHYRLMVVTSAPRPAMPMPRWESTSHQYEFQTVATPRLAVGTEEFEPRWAEPVAVQWSKPVQSAEITVEPEVPAQVWIDADPTRAWVRLDSDAGAGTTHKVTFTRVVAADGTVMARPASIGIALPERPRIVEPPKNPVMLRRGESLELESSLALAGINADVQGDLPARVTLDGQSVKLALPEFRQGTETSVTLSGVGAERGAPLEPVTLTVRTPDPLETPSVEPAAGARNVPLQTRPVVRFEAPPADPDKVRRLVSTRPAIAGEWKWVDAQTLELVPAARLPEQTQVTVTVRGGPDGVRAAGGGYMEKDYVSSFVTGISKRIEVSLAKQQLHMIESEKVVRTIVVGTGVRGAETPLGQYEVLYKVPVTRMQGVNPSGQRYDIPDVPWVLPFMGDYAIHGVHWRNTFGAPASNGCVGMTVAESKLLYDWADVGTPIHIYQ